MPNTAILWFRRDLRLDDNPALVRAMTDNERVLPLYIHAPDEEAPWSPGAAGRWWLHGSLGALDRDLCERGSRLLIAAGESLAVLERISALTGATRVYWNRLYDPATRARDTRIKLALRARGLHCESHNALLLRGRGSLPKTSRTSSPPMPGSTRSEQTKALSPSLNTDGAQTPRL